MKLRYFSIDIETTGLDPEKDQILEIGIVYDDLTKQLHIEKLPVFHCYVVNERVEGNAFALSMNHKILERIAKREKGYRYYRPTEVVNHLKEWLDQLERPEKLIIAGKNVASFDMPFLRKLEFWDKTIKTHHRVLDPGMLYLNSEDEVGPDLAECKRRAGFKDLKVAHTAVEDALDVVRLLRHSLNCLDK